MEERRHYRGGFVWPVVLIGAGIVFLLNNLGVISWDVWATLLRLWPLLLIAVGLDILVGRRFPLGSALLALTLVVVLALGVRGSLPLVNTSVSSVTVDRTETVSQQTEGVEKASVSIGFGSGALNIAALAPNSDLLIEGAVDLSKGESIRKEYRTTGGAGVYTLESTGSWSSGPDLIVSPSKNWDLNLNQDLPLELKVNAGAGKSTIDMTNLTLRRFDLDGGVGQVTVKLADSGRYDVRIDGGVGQVIIMIPQGLGARVQVDGGLGGVTTQGDFTHRGDVYTTGNYDTAENRATVYVSGGVGQTILKTLSE